jgi:hypothetical protein
VIKFWAVQIF